MGRRPSVFVRPVSTAEGRRLQRISRTAKEPVKLRRTIVVLMSAQGRTVKDITTLMQVGEDYVREVIHALTSGGSTRWTQNGVGDVPGPSMTRCASASA